MHHFIIIIALLLLNFIWFLDKKVIESKEKSTNDVKLQNYVKLIVKETEYPLCNQDFLRCKDVITRNESWLKLKKEKLRQQSAKKYDKELNGCSFTPRIYTSSYRSPNNSQSNLLKNSVVSQSSVRFSIRKETGYEKEFMKKKIFSEQKRLI